MSTRRHRTARPSREERRGQLLEAAVEAIRDVGPQASMEQLAARGGVTKPILYRHFGDRSGLARAIGDQFTDILVARLAETAAGPDDPRRLLWRTIDTYLSFLEEEPNLYAFLTETSPGDQVEAAAIVETIARQVAVTVGDGLRAAGLDAGGAEPYAYGIVGMVHQAGDWWIRSRTMSREALTTYLADLLWNGFDGLASVASEQTAAEAPLD